MMYQCKEEHLVPVYNSRRSAVMGTRGMVASSQPLASEAGLRILQQGGTAADAAVAMAAALNVTEPCSTGIGGDAFCLYYEAKTRRVHCLMGNGGAPAELTLEGLRARGVEGNQIPPQHALTVTVPGAAALWDDCVSKFGKLSLKQVLQPAIELAESGFPVSPVTAYHWQQGLPLLRAAAAAGGAAAATSALMTPSGGAPTAGELFRNPDLAATFRAVAERGAREGFYRGRIAEAIVTALRERGGVLSAQDLEEHATRVVEPISTTYKGYTVYETPPPAVGLAALLALNYHEAALALQQRDDAATEKAQSGGGSSSGSAAGAGGGGGDDWASSGRLHRAIEAARLSFYDVLAHLGDPEQADVPVAALLDKARCAARMAEHYDPRHLASIRPDATIPSPDASHRDSATAATAAAAAGRVEGTDTVYFNAVDGDGNGCSFINSNYMGFGTGIVPAGCGFSLQNRGANFVLQPGHPNCVAPRKRPYHTIIPGLITDAQGRLFATIGVMGGFMQPQGQLQVISNLLDWHMDPQLALDMPRFCLDQLSNAAGPACVAAGSTVKLEEGLPAAASSGLQAKGHGVVPNVSGHERALFGKGQIIMRNPETGVLWAGSDPRGDGCAVGY